MKEIKYQRKPANESPEQATLRRLNNRDYRRQQYKIKIAQETPEQAAARRVKVNKYRKKLREKRQAEDTPEQAAERRFNERIYQRQYYLSKLAHEISEQAAECQTADELEKMQTQAYAEEPTSNNLIVKTEVNSDYEFDESWSSFKGSEGCNSQSTYEGSTSLEFKRNFSDASSEQKSQPSIERDKIKSENEDSIPKEDLTASDEHLEYVKSILKKLRACNRSKSDIDKAKMRIDKILANLSTGVHKGFNSDEPTDSAVVQTVIVKEEVDF